MDGARELAWAVPRTGSRALEVEGEFVALVQDLEGFWGQLFPTRLGYATTVEAISEHTVRLGVTRGDFGGELHLSRDRAIRAVSSAQSQRLASTLERGLRVAQRSRRLTTGVGAALASAGCWLVVSSSASPAVQMPFMLIMAHIMLGFLLIAIVAWGGQAIGSRLGEGIALRSRSEVQRELDMDSAVQADLRRWRSLNRRLRVHHRVLACGRVGSPFRRPATGP